MDGGLFEGPGRRRQVNGLKGAAPKGLLRECSNWRWMCLFEGMERWLGTGRKFCCIYFLLLIQVYIYIYKIEATSITN